MVEKFVRQTDAHIKAGVNEEVNKLAEILRQKVPVRSGELKDSIKVNQSRLYKTGATRASITIGNDDVPYAQAIDEGSEKGKKHYASKVYMKFTEWERGPSSMRWADGYFRFRVVNHIVPAQHYIQKSWDEYNKNNRSVFAERIRGIFFK